MSRKPSQRTLISDPHYLKILDRLAGRLSGEKFQACIADLLRPDLPGLVPVSCGPDGGWDGAAPSEHGDPIPLICTTQRNVKGNLRKSLIALRKASDPPKFVVAATSQQLGSKARHDLHGIAQEFGFGLRPPFDRSALADRLYRNSRWSRDLLGVSGEPSALSIVPMTKRPLIALEPVGRSEDLEWLRSGSGDRVLVGQPGSGKTFLFHHLMRNGWHALFLTSSDRTAVANAFRDLEPGVVVVDDAQLDLEMLLWLRQFRREIGATFDIAASTWPGAKDKVVEALGGIPEAKVRALELLTRQEILEVYQNVGIDEDDDTLRSLIDQAARKPGLATTIAQIWLQGEWRSILDGTVLSRTIRAFFESEVGPNFLPILAAFSAGGRRGLSIDAVAKCLGEPRLSVYRAAAALAAGGVLTEVTSETLAVGPAALRSAFIREAFFPRIGPSLPGLTRLVEGAESFESSVKALLDARQYGATIPSELLWELVERTDKQTVWEHLAALSEPDFKWALERYVEIARRRGLALNEGDRARSQLHYREKAVSLARAALFGGTEAAIGTLLLEAEEEYEEGPPATSRPLEILEKWARLLPFDWGVWLRNRRLLIESAKLSLASGHNRLVGLLAVLSAFGAILEKTSTDPVTGSTLTLRKALPDVSAIKALRCLWSEAMADLEDLPAAIWPRARSLLGEWLEPANKCFGLRPSEGSTEAREMRAFAVHILHDLAARSRQSAGLRTALSRLANSIGEERGLVEDLDFGLLFPSWTQVLRDVGNGDDSRRAGEVPLEELASRWATCEPKAIAETLELYSREAEAIGYGWPRNTRWLCEALAERVAEPAEWLRVFTSSHVSEEQVEPFLTRLRKDDSGKWIEFVSELLSNAQYKLLAAVSVLMGSPIPADLAERSLVVLEQHPEVIRNVCCRGELPLGIVKHLLSHPDGRVARAAAVGEWSSEPKEEVRNEVLAEWEEAVLGENRAAEWDLDLETSDSFWWLEILKKRPMLAKRWLRRNIKLAAASHQLSRARGLLSLVVGSVPVETRKEIIADLRSDKIPTDLMTLLIGRDPASRTSPQDEVL